jgi:hypothetical protein
MEGITLGRHRRSDSGADLTLAAESVHAVVAADESMSMGLPGAIRNRCVIAHARAFGCWTRRVSAEKQHRSRYPLDAHGFGQSRTLAL